MSRLVFGCPECRTTGCHRQIDEIAGAGRTAIPVRDRWGRKRGETYCENGCGCEDCVAYWKAHNEQFEERGQTMKGKRMAEQPCELCSDQPATIRVIVENLNGKRLDEKLLCKDCATHAPNLDVSE